MTSLPTITRCRTRAMLGRLLAWTALFAACFSSRLPAQVADGASSYRLNLRDEIEVQIFDENDLNTSQRIDGGGQIRIQLIGAVVVAGKTVREAEDFIEALYVEKRILRNPMVTIRVLQYAPREVNVLGEVGTPGALLFPAEINEMDIVDVVAKSGGFTQLARRNRVEVTRIGPDGKATVREINVDDMIRGRTRDGARFMVRPGDTISVPAIIF